MSPVTALPAAPGGYVRPTWREALAEYLPPHRRGAAADRWIDRLPLLVVLGVSAALSLRLGGTASVDEAHAVTVGNDYFVHWFGGAPGVDHGADFPGSPVLYPVLAAVLDSLGGLRLVRLFSLVCVLATTALLMSVVRRVTASYRTGLLAACAFTLTAPVVHVGALATPDAACLLLLALAARAATGGRSTAAACGAGAALVAAVAVSYPTVVLLPAVVLLAAAAALRDDGPPGRAWGLAGVACTLLAGVLTMLHLGADDPVRAGFLTSVWRGAAVSPQAPGTLLGWTVLSFAGLAALALAGTVHALRGPRARRDGPVTVVLLVTGVAIPLARAVAGEGHLFHESTAPAALFLAAPAGLALTALSRRLFRATPVAVVLLVSLVPVASWSASMHASWADVTPVLRDIDAHPQPGRYLSSASDTLAYHSRDDHPEITWDAATTLYRRGAPAVRDAVAQRAYQVVFLRSVSSAGPDQDVLLDALARSPDYEPEALGPVAGPGDRWLVYRLVNRVP